MLTKEQARELIKILSIWVPESDRSKFTDFIKHNLEPFTENETARIIKSLKMIADIIDGQITNSEDSDKLEEAIKLLENNNAN